MRIVVYTKLDCVQCKATKRELDKLELIYETRDTDLDWKAHRDALAMGFTSLPIVVVSHANGKGVQRWAGHRPDKIRSLVS